MICPSDGRRVVKKFEPVPRPLLLKREGEKNIHDWPALPLHFSREGEKNIHDLPALPLLFPREGGRGDEFSSVKIAEADRQNS